MAPVSSPAETATNWRPVAAISLSMRPPPWRCASAFAWPLVPGRNVTTIWPATARLALGACADGYAFSAKRPPRTRAASVRRDTPTQWQWTYRRDRRAAVEGFCDLHFRRRQDGQRPRQI